MLSSIGNAYSTGYRDMGENVRVTPIMPPDGHDRPVQRRTVAVLVTGQVLSGLGAGAIVAMGSIIAADIAGAPWAGAAVTASTLGAAAAAVPLARLAVARGRRIALTSGILLAALGSVLVIAADAARLLVLLLVGAVALGAGTAVNLQARFAATDLAAPVHRGRDLSLVVWSTTIGAVIGPNLFGPGEVLSAVLHLPANSGAFVIALVAQLATAALYLVAMRPDPLLLARAQADAAEATATATPAAAPATAALATPAPSTTAASTTAASMTAADADPRRRAATRPLVLAIASIGIAHAVMVAVMAMTPVHLTGHGASIEIVGLVISLHVAGMYALSPVFGWASDRLGRLPIMVLGAVVLAASLVTLGLAPEEQLAVTTGLILLGLGWSAVTVAGAALVTDLADGPDRVRIQGRTDMTMSLSGAAAGAAAGPVLAAVGYGGLAATTGVLVLVLLVLAAAIRRRMRPTAEAA